MQPDQVPVRCPVLPSREGPDDALLDRLADPAPVTDPLSFPRGTLQPDGRLDLCKQGLNRLDAERILPAAIASPHALHLLLGTNNLGAPGVAALAGALTDGHRVRTLYLGCNHIDAEGVRPLARRLATDRTVRAVWLKRNPLGDDGVRAVADALRDNRSVRTLDLTNTGLTPPGLRALAEALRARGVPTERIYLGGNGFGPETAELLAQLLHSAGVKELYLAAGRLGDEGAAVLAEAVPAGRRVVLGLGGNGLGPAGIRALATKLAALDALDLARPPSAQALRAVPNVVGDDGAAALAEALPGSGLRRLDLRHTGVTGRGAHKLLTALERCLAGPAQVPAHDERCLTGPAQVPAHDERCLTGPAQVPAHDGTGNELEQLGLGSGVPRRIKRAVSGYLRPLSAPAEDILAVSSVYR